MLLLMLLLLLLLLLLFVLCLCCVFVSLFLCVEDQLSFPLWTTPDAFSNTPSRGHAARLPRARGSLGPMPF